MATPTLQDFLSKAKPLNPDYTDDEIIQQYEQRYGSAVPEQTVRPAPLTTFEEFLPKAKALNPDYSDQEIRDHWDEKYGSRGARERDQGDFLRGAETSFKQIPQTLRGLEAGAGAIGEKAFGEGGVFTALKEHGLKGYQEYATEIAKDSKPSDSVTDAYKMARAGDPGALVDWLQYTLGYAGGQAVQMLATAGLGYAAGKVALQPVAAAVAEKMIAKETARLSAQAGATLTGDALTRQAVSNVAGKIGQLGALGATAVGMEGGEIYGGLVNQAAQEGRSLTGSELAKAAGATLGAGALEFVGDKIGLDLILGKSLAGKLVSSRLGQAGASAAVGTVAEGGTEFTQTLLEEFGKGNDPFSADSIKQAIDASAVGGVAGGSVGAIGGLVNQPSSARSTTEPSVTERTAQDLGMPTAVTDRSSPSELTTFLGHETGPVIQASGSIASLPDVSAVLNAGSLDEAIAHFSALVDAPIPSQSDLAQPSPRTRRPEETAIFEPSLDPINVIPFEAKQASGRYAATVLPEDAPRPTKIGMEEAARRVQGLAPQESIIEPGQSFTPRQEPVLTPKERLAQERERLVSMQEARRLERQSTPQGPVLSQPSSIAVPSEEPVPLRTQAELIYPTHKDVRSLIHAKGFHLDTPVFREYLKTAIGKEKFSDLTPHELQQLSDKLAQMNDRDNPKSVTEESQRQEVARRTVAELDVPSMEGVKGPSVQEIHAAAEAKGLAWDNNPAFMDLTEQATGKRHLDHLTGPERVRVMSAIASVPEQSMPSLPTAPVLEPLPAAPPSSEGQVPSGGIETAPIQKALPTQENGPVQQKKPWEMTRTGNPVPSEVLADYPELQATLEQSAEPQRKPKNTAGNDWQNYFDIREVKAGEQVYKDGEIVTLTEPEYVVMDRGASSVAARVQTRDQAVAKAQEMLAPKLTKGAYPAIAPSHDRSMAQSETAQSHQSAQSNTLTIEKIPADLMITLSVEIEQTGETREVEVNARKAWKQARQKVNRLTKLLECIG